MRRPALFPVPTRTRRAAPHTLAAILGTLAGVTAAATEAAAAAPAAILYDGTAGSLPSSQGWPFLTDPLFIAKARQSMTNGAAVIDSSAAITDKAGWFSNLAPFPKHPRQPPLDAAAGFVLSFTVRVVSEAHNRPERAGFSVIATASDLSSIELGFWTDEVWAQSGTDFLHAEGAPFDTTADRVRYDLEFRNGRYRLAANGRPLLDGPLRRYAGFGTPYNIPEFLFLGDDTTSAAAIAEVARVTVSPLPSIRIEVEGAQLALSADAESGRTVAFEASGDLASWSEVGAAVSTDGMARITVAPDAPHRFLRAVLR